MKSPLKIVKDLNNQARYLRETGDTNDFAAARPLLERAVAISEKALGPEHPVVAEGLSILALHLEDAENLAAARPLFERALAIYEKTLGPEHLFVARTLLFLAFHLHSTGDAEDFAIARSLYERALAIYEKVFGLEHPNVAHSLNDLAIYLWDTGDAEDFVVARTLYERALAIIEGYYGPASAEAGVILYQLGSLLGELNEFDLAETLLRRGLDITIEQSGRNSQDTLERIDKLAEVLEAKDNLRDISVLRKDCPKEPENLDHRNQTKSLLCKKYLSLVK